MSHDLTEMPGMLHDIREECYIRVMIGRCVNKPGQTKPVGCYENSLISNISQLCKRLLFHIFFVCFEGVNVLNSS